MAPDPFSLSLLSFSDGSWFPFPGWFSSSVPMAPVPFSLSLLSLSDGSSFPFPGSLSSPVPVALGPFSSPVASSGFSDSLTLWLSASSPSDIIPPPSTIPASVCSPVPATGSPAAIASAATFVTASARTSTDTNTFLNAQSFPLILRPSLKPSPELRVSRGSAPVYHITGVMR